MHTWTEKRAYVIVAGKHQFFPKRELGTIEYSIEDTYQGLYQQLRGYLGQPKKGKSNKTNNATFATRGYGLYNYVDPARQKREPVRQPATRGLHAAGTDAHPPVQTI